MYVTKFCTEAILEVVCNKVNVVKVSTRLKNKGKLGRTFITYPGQIDVS